jgi:hypothetical protein
MRIPTLRFSQSEEKIRIVIERNVHVDQANLSTQDPSPPAVHGFRARMSTHDGRIVTETPSPEGPREVDRLDE